jgi:DNA-binding MarR family transcriptional regulator
MSSQSGEASSSYNLAQALHDPYIAMIRRLHEHLDSVGFSDVRPAHGNVMGQLPVRGGARITDIATNTHLTKQTIGYLVDDLEQLGYVERIPDPTDARARLVCYTAKGRAARRNAGAAFRAIEAQWSRKLGGRQMQQLRQLLDDLRAVIDAEETERARNGS